MIGGTGILLLGFNYALLNWGLQFISSGLTAVLQSMTPAFALIFAHYLLPDERMTRRKSAGLALGIAGVATIFWDQLTFGGGRAFAGSVTVTLGAVCVALAYVIVRREGRHLHPSVLTTGQMTAAFVPLMVYGWTVEGNPFELQWTRNAIAAALYLALAGSVVAAWLNYWLLSRVGAVNLLLMGLIEPIIAILLGSWFLGESINSRALAGGLADPLQRLARHGAGAGAGAGASAGREVESAAGAETDAHTRACRLLSHPRACWSHVRPGAAAFECRPGVRQARRAGHRSHQHARDRRHGEPGTREPVNRHP